MARIIGPAVLNRVSNQRPSAHPRHWPGWLSVFLIELCARIPPALAEHLSHPLGWLMYQLLRRRRQIAHSNIRACFPALNATQHRQLTKAHFRSLASMLFESAWVWSGRNLSALQFEIHGRELLEQEPHRPLLIISGHMTCMDLCSCYLSGQVAMAGVYRPLRSAVLEWYHTRGRLRFASKMISKYDFKGMLGHLKEGHKLWYAPDQDFGLKRSVFVPFFGQPCATLKASWILAQRSKARVVTMLPRRTGVGHYCLEIRPIEQPPKRLQKQGQQTAAEQQLPFDASMQFLTEINQHIEAAIKKAPEQYWWVHRRFKTRPPGYPSLY